MSAEIIKQYISRQLIEEEAILKSYASDEKERYYLKRFIFYRLEEYISEFLQKKSDLRWILLPGLRGVGKTTVLAQLFFLLQNNFKNRILYISVDDIVNKLNSNLYEVLDCYEE